MQSNPESPLTELTSISGEPAHYWVGTALPRRKETVVRLSSLLLAGLGAVLLIAVVLLVLGVSFRRPVASEGAALYDPKAEVTLTGVVAEVREFTCPVSEREMGSHLVLKTQSGDVLVHLAPGRIMRSQNIKFAPGDQLIVVGSRTRVVGSKDLIAREIVRGSEDYVLRDASGQLMLIQ